jgi:signal transduction histidine kinase
MDKGLNTSFRIFANPYLLSVIPALVIAWLFPVNLSRYLLETLATEYMNNRTFYFYEDLTGDGYSEKIKLEETFNANSMVIYDHRGRIFSQWNLHGHFGFAHNYCLFIAGDYDGDGQKEMYVFSLSNDSIYLHALKRLTDNDWFIKKRFLARAGAHGHGPDVNIVPAEMTDLNGDGKKELVFGINTGFSRQPRNVYAYYIDRDSLVVSPESHVQITSIRQADLNGNGKKELLITTYASANIRPELATFHDHSAWAMVLDQDLQFLFPPVEFPGLFTSAIPTTIPGFPGERLAVLVSGDHREMTSMYFFNEEWEITREIKISGSPEPVYYYERPGDKPLVVFAYQNEGLKAFDTLLNPLRSYLIKGRFSPNWGLVYHLGAPDETVIAAAVRETNTFHVIRSDLRQPVTAEISWTEGQDPIISVIHRGKKRPHISLQVGRNHYIFDYRLNPKYYQNFAFYPLTYLAVLVFALLITRLQKNKIRRDQEIERKITELQLSLVKNQLDPHFMLNALNAVMHAAQDQRYEDVETGLSYFSRLYRNMLLSAGKIRRSLEEELAFTESYLELEKLRYGGRFDYRIEVAPEADKSVLLPTMIIQLHVENAVKHGLSPLKNGGMLRIGAEASDGKLMLTIEDNGIGRANAKAGDRPSTGLGLQLMDELYGLYRKYYGQQIIAEITDLIDAQGQPAGTRVRILMY